MRYLRVGLYVLAGIGVSLGYTAAVGLLSVQALAARAGAVLDLDNIVVGVQPPSIPYWQMSAIVGGALLAAYAVASAPRHRPVPERIAISSSFLACTVALLIYTFANIQGGDSLLSVADGALPGWQGWLVKASNDSSLHLMLVMSALLVGIQLLRARQHRSSRKGG